MGVFGTGVEDDGCTFLEGRPRAAFIVAGHAHVLARNAGPFSSNARTATFTLPFLS